jgi:hypothetical protein
MKIRPILFNTEMVRAILEGRKTCTRRVLKQPFEVHPNGYITKPRGNERLCPYIPPYQPGDILYVRETWCKGSYGDEKEKYYYKADDNNFFCTWHPSIHMPKEAARIWLKVTNVRVERLQEITGDGCIAEGVYPSPCRKCNATFGCDTCPDEGYHETDGFSELWNSTIKKSDLDVYGWLANPYVWVVEFERCDKPPECILKGYDKAPDDGGKCLGYMYDDSDELIPMCKKCSYQESYESEEEK